MAIRRNILEEDNNLSDGGYYNPDMIEALEWAYSHNICQGCIIYTRLSLSALFKEVRWEKDEDGKDIVLDSRSRFYEVISVY